MCNLFFVRKENKAYMLFTHTMLFSILMISTLFFVCGCKNASPAPVPIEIDQAENATEKTELCAMQEPFVLFINVGKADAALVYINDEYFLIDTGTEQSAPLLFGVLNQLGVERLSAVFLTHTHSDHIGGFPALSAYYSIDHVYMPAYSLLKKGKENPITETARLSDVPLTKLSAGERILAGGDAYFEVLGPLVQNEDDDNDNSLVLRFVYQNMRILFTGDMQFAQEQTLLGKYDDLHADILKVGNHGNPDASSEGFIQAVSPKLAVISTDTTQDTDSANERVLTALSSAEIALTQNSTVGVGVYLNEGMQRFDPQRVEAKLSLSVWVDVKRQEAYLKNIDVSQADLSGCVLLSERGGELFRFPDGTQLAPDEVCTIGGFQSDCIYSFPFDQSPWSKKKEDRAFIYDAGGNLIGSSEE